MNESDPLEETDPAADAARRQSPLVRLLPWLITVLCFAYLYRRIAAQTAADQSVLGYLAEIFAAVSWWHWLALMVPYSVLFLLIDTLVLWRVVNWFNARVSYPSLLPVRASAYIISILNEQVGKGAIALYLNRREGVPAWQVGSSMLFIMFCEFFYLLGWALVGWLLRRDQLPDVFDAIPAIAVGAVIFFFAFVYYFRSERFRGSSLRDRQLLLAFRKADVWQYATITVLRSPALLAAVFVYARCAALFGVEVELLDMLGFLPVIFFGTLVPGPFRAVAVSMWPILFTGHDAQMTAFGFVQHNFFVLFNACFGLLFLRRANREMYGSDE
jgi:hypothetical protein